MSFLSLIFFLFLAAAVIVYYLVPKKTQWIVLLAASLAFYVYATRMGLAVLLLETLVIYLLVRWMEQRSDHAKKLLVLICILAAVVMLLLLKYLPESMGSTPAFSGWFLKDLLMPLGISYYTLMIISYAVDVYREQIPAENNYAKLLLFVFYFPSITQGPINRYKELTPQFYEAHTFDADELFTGLFRFAWGCFKKMVIANRTAALITAVYASSKASGVIILLALLLTMLQLYTDFSGCADMAIGVSQILQIRLPENFRQPYFSRSIEEYWRRWHITLGAWLKDYIYLPISASRASKWFIKKGADRQAKRRRTKIVQIAALMVLWIVMGIWHGSGVKFFIMGVYYGIIFIVTMLLTPLAQRFDKKYPKLVASPVYKFWQQVRTTLLLWLAPVIFSVQDLGQLKSLVGKVFTSFRFGTLFDGTILKYDLDGLQLILLAVGFLSLLAVSVIEYNKKKVFSELVRKQKWFVRILIWWFVIILILLSLNIANTEFIYAQF